MSSLYRYYRYEATLFDGTSTTEVVSGETAFWDSTHDGGCAATRSRCCGPHGGRTDTRRLGPSVYPLLAHLLVDRVAKQRKPTPWIVTSMHGGGFSH
jgi:hypothetical protein